MWEKKTKKTIFTLNVNGYSKEITDITYPLIQRYADKIGANLHTITERKFPEFPPVYEKLQIYELAQQMENDWNIYIDSDALIHPECIDYTAQIPKSVILHNAFDMAAIRWRYDRFFLRDGRNIGSANWFAVASDWCIELWKPLDDLNYEQALKNIDTSVVEMNSNVVVPSHLIDDYVLSRNIAKYGLKAKSVHSLMLDLGFGKDEGFFWHQYIMNNESKVKNMINVLEQWQVEKYVPVNIRTRILELRNQKQASNPK
jgi:hypothetical protein